MSRFSITSAPTYNLRLLNHWDNPNGTVERGFAGHSIFWPQVNDDILLQYACADARNVKLLNDSTLYHYSLDSGSFSEEYTFPEIQDINTGAGQSGTLKVFEGIRSAYINENTGKLYFAYDKYKKFNKPEGMAVEIVVYDLEAAAVELGPSAVQRYSEQHRALCA